MAIPEYNFYYKADQVHNPGRNVVWTDVYVDPAGLGWMTSAIAPVYRGDFLEGVVGLDVTVKTIVQQILQLDIPWQGYVMLINRQGIIMALPSKGEDDFGVQELTRFSYSEAITRESFKPEQFNIQQRADTRVLAEMMRNAREGRGTLQLGGREKRVAWQEIGATGWQLLAVVDEAEVYRSVDDLARDFRLIGYLLIAGLLLFYLLFFVYIWRRSVWLSGAISTPLDTLNRIMVNIGQEHYEQPRPRFELQELQQSADAVVAMGAELGRANRAKSRFLSSVSHELRTPLSSIIGFAELLRGSNRLGADEQACVDEILHAAHLLLSLINDVLDLAQVQADHVSVRAEHVPLGELVDGCLRMVEPQATQKGVQLFRVEGCCESLVWADPKRVQQVLLNLLSNAIKYNRPEGQVRVVCRDLGDHVRISVSDTGWGMSAEAQQGLFVPFNRLGHETSNIPGTGIGLTISKQLVELMGGRIGCDSVPEHGSTFWVELPTADEEDAAAQD
ncbi:MAG: ATPase [Oceanospirillales bacterium]|nr:ATPase [Oceanospirillales bacterium]